MHQVTKDGTCIFTDGNFSTNIYDMYIQEFNLGHDFGNRSLDNIEYIGPKTTDKTRTVYSDRLFQWDPEKYNRCCMAIWNNNGQWFHHRKPTDIEKFLSMYFDKPITLNLSVCIENRATGFPCWRFDYTENKSRL